MSRRMHPAVAPHSFTSWMPLLREYDALHARNEAAELEWYSRLTSLSAAIQFAGNAINRSGRRFDHQCLIRREAIPAATLVLHRNERDIARAGSFHELFETVERYVRPIFGIGPLYSYDTALRIGAFRGLLPDRVYLHAGTREGAKALGLPHRKVWLLNTELPRELASRAPHEIENILCIYAARFAGIANRISRCGRRKHATRRPTLV